MSIAVDCLDPRFYDQRLDQETQTKEQRCSKDVARTLLVRLDTHRSHMRSLQR